MNEPHPQVIDIYRRARTARVRIGPLMIRAGLRPATWSGWMRGRQPNTASLTAVEAALKEMGG